jgi:hypothetical protein
MEDQGSFIGRVVWKLFLSITLAFPGSYQRVAEAYFSLVKQLEHKAGHFI